MSDTVAVTLPSMGESVTEGIVARWVKAAGDPVKQGETVVEVTTDKVDVEVPAPASGRLAEIVAAEGATVEVGATLARIDIADGAAAATAPPANERPAHVAEAGPEQDAPTPAHTGPQGGMLGEAAEPRSVVAERATPLARRAAALRGVDVAALGSGNGDRVVRRADVDGGEPRQPQAAGHPIPPGAAVVALRGPQAALVDHMERSREIPTATSFRTISVAVLDARRRELNIALSAAGQTFKLSYTHLIAHAVARAARDMPEMAEHFSRDGEGNPVRVQNGVQLGIAVDSRRKDGSRFLVVPVIRDADTLPFAAFREEYDRLIDRARTNTLTADELRGAT
ncbi:MAG: 2-oxo acid dehydrogenase subunit E2, partial [Candidatus Dormibacteraeota bacterium]|nr:2-oxo acid dehydrogenase subunit E2 [Candidatus Dormibacteraeota bacterium]